jgi:TonB family protein
MCLRKRVVILTFCTTILLASISPSQAQQDQSDARARKMLTKVVPIYPSLAQKMGIAGSVKVEVLVAPNGSAKSTQVLGGHPVLAQAGIEAVRYFKWEPTTHETKEVVIFNFHPN